MPTIQITGWREGLRKISLTHVLQQEAGLSMAAAKACTDRVLEGETVSVTLPDVQAARHVATRLTELGAVVQVLAHGADA